MRISKKITTAAAALALAAGRRGQILHLTAYRPIGNGELGSMPPYYPP